jgi:hypothetical protein
MNIIVGKHLIELDKEELTNEKEINVTKCHFVFDDDITDEFVKEAYFTLKTVTESNTYKQIIVNNECDIPNEVLEKKGIIELGVVAYKIDNEDVEIRYNPTPCSFETLKGSLKDAENSEPITPSEMEQYEQILNDGLLEVQNVNIDANKIDNIATITITNRNGITKEVTISDGEKGDKGDKGNKGDTGPAGRDGCIQYTAGNNITIEDNIISASVNGKEDTSNKVTVLSSYSTDTQYPSAKCVYDLVGDIESLLGDI